MKITRYKRNSDSKIKNRCSYNIDRSFSCADSFTRYTSNNEVDDFNILKIENHNVFFKKHPKLINVINKLDGEIKNEEIIFDSKHKAIFVFRIIRMTSAHFNNILDILYDILEKSNLGIFSAIQLMEHLWAIKHKKFVNYGICKNYIILKMLGYKEKGICPYYKGAINFFKKNGSYILNKYECNIESNEYYRKIYNKGFITTFSSSAKSLFKYRYDKNIRLSTKEQIEEYFNFCNKVNSRLNEISKFKRYGTMLNAIKKLNKEIETKY